MIRLTQEGKIKWTAFTGVIGLTYLNERSPGYKTTYQNRHLRIYKDYGATILEFVDQNGISLYQFPKSQALNDLLSAVRYQSAGVKDFINDLLDPKPKQK